MVTLIFYCLLVGLGYCNTVGDGNSSIHYPTFSWDTVPVFWQGCNVSGAFNDTALDALEKFSMVVIEKGQGMNGTIPGWYAEDYQNEAAKQVKQRNKNIELVWYVDSVQDWVMYKMHYEFLNHSDWWLRNCSGDIIYQHSGAQWKQPPQGMLTYDFANKSCVDWWQSKCYNMTKNGYFDGCNIDHVYQTSFPGICNNTAINYKKNKFEMLPNLQKQLNDSGGGPIWLNYGQIVPGVRALAFEGWGNFEGAIWDMNNVTHDNPNIMIKAHAGYCTKNNNGTVKSNCGCVGQSLINDLATFLVCAKKYAYFNCNTDWLMNTTNYGWYDEYNKPLGEPLQYNGVKVDDTYYRSFATGTAAIFNATSRQGRIFWSNEWDYKLLNDLTIRINDWNDNGNNYHVVNKRRVYFKQFDILL